MIASEDRYKTDESTFVQLLDHFGDSTKQMKAVDYFGQERLDHFEDSTKQMKAHSFNYFGQERLDHFEDSTTIALTRRRTLHACGCTAHCVCNTERNCRCVLGDAANDSPNH